jgi:hypothetical protein
MATKFTPLHDRILVRRIEEVGTTRGGLIIPDSAKDKPKKGKSSRSARARLMTKVRSFLSWYNQATTFCLASTPDPRSRLTEKISSS